MINRGREEKNMTVAKNYSVHLYFILWCLYYLQGVLYDKGGNFSRGILVIVLFVSIIHFVRSHRIGIPRTIKWIDGFMAMIVVYGLIAFAGGYVSNLEGMTSMDYIKGVLVSFLPIYSFYYYSVRGEIDENHLFVWTIVLLVVYSLTFIYKGTEDNSLLSVVTDIEEGTNNAGYLMVSLIPLLFFLAKRPVLQYSALAIIVLFAITSVKRGAISVGLIMAITLVLYSFKKGKAWQKGIVAVLFVGVGYLGFQYVLYLMSSSEFVNMRIEQTAEGDSSMRDDIYGFFFNYFIHQDSAFSFLFGNGAFATGRIYRFFAHNDWLELAINQGVLGLIVYLNYWISLYKDWRKCHDYKTVYVAMGMASLFLLFRTFVSMSYSMIPLSCSLMLGYGLAMSARNSYFTRIK